MSLAVLDDIRPMDVRLHLPDDLDLEESKTYWPRAGVDSERVDTYMEVLRNRMGALPAITVVAHATRPGKYIVADGMHRVHAYLGLMKEGRAGFASIDAKAYPIGTDAYLLAIRAVGAGALPLKDTEKGASIDRLLQTHAEMSERQIARLAGASHTYVQKRKKALEGGSTPERVATVATPTPERVATVATETADDDDEDRPAWLFFDALADLRDNTQRWGRFGFGKKRPSAQGTADELVDALEGCGPDDARDYVGLLEHFSESARLAVKQWAQRS